MKRSSLNLLSFTKSLRSFEVDEISLILTLISFDPLTRLNFDLSRPLKH